MVENHGKMNTISFKKKKGREKWLLKMAYLICVVFVAINVIFFMYASVASEYDLCKKKRRRPAMCRGLFLRSHTAQNDNSFSTLNNKCCYFFFCNIFLIFVLWYTMMSCLYHALNLSIPLIYCIYMTRV